MSTRRGADDVAAPVEVETSDERRAWAGSFGADAARYDRARPSYPPELVERILAVSPGPEVLDVGCGTGIVARQFAAAGARVLGVELDERMAEQARRSGLEVEVSAFEAWDPAGRRFDAVVAGQAWHWIDAVAGAAKAAAALRPGGPIALFWNAFTPPAELARDFADVNRRFLSGRLASMWDKPALDGYRALCRLAAGGIAETGSYRSTEEWSYEWDVTYTRDDWLDQLPTFGGHSQLPAQQLADLVGGIGAAIDAAGGSFPMHYTTVVVTALRSDQPSSRQRQNG